MTQVLKAISNYLNKHNTHHSAYINAIQILHNRQGLTSIYHYQHNEQQIKITTNHPNKTTILNIADPNLLPRILQICQRT